MSHRAKVMSLAFVIAAALSAAAASGAVAEDHYGAPLAPTVVTGTQEVQKQFVTDGGSWTCNTAEARGTQGTVLANDLILTTVTTGCTIFGIANTHVKMNGCYDTYTTPVSVPDTNPQEFTIDSPHTVCPEGRVIEITPTIFGSSVCTMTMPPQTPTSGHVLATNVDTSGQPREVTLTFTVTGIHYTVDGGGGLCGPTGGTTTHGEVKGSFVLKGFDDTSAASDEQHSNVREPFEILNT